MSTMPTKPLVIGMGAVAWDRFLVVPRFPEPDSKIRALASDECAGGTVGTALVALARWRITCGYLGILGYDDISDRIVHDLEAEAVDLTHVQRRGGCEGRRSLILVDNRTGQRTVVSGPHRLATLYADDLEPGIFAGVRLLHLDTSDTEGALAVIERARREEPGITITLDAERLDERTPELIRRVDHVIAAASFARELTGENRLSRAAYALHLITERPVAVTEGPHGVEYASATDSFHQPAFPVPVVDSTGAGDVFHAGYLFGLVSAWSARQTVKFAAWAGACVCRELGGRKGIPTWQAVREYGQRESN